MTNLIPRLSEVIDADLIAQGKGLDGIDAEMIAESVFYWIVDFIDENDPGGSAHWLRMQLSRTTK